MQEKFTLGYSCHKSKIIWKLQEKHWVGSNGHVSHHPRAALPKECHTSPKSPAPRGEGKTVVDLWLQTEFPDSIRWKLFVCFEIIYFFGLVIYLPGSKLVKYKKICHLCPPPPSSHLHTPQEALLFPEYPCWVSLCICKEI